MFKNNIPYLISGMWFGILLTKGEVISWYRIQEMFRFQSFHMYGVIGSAVITGIISLWLLKILKVKSLDGTAIVPITKKFNWGFVYGSFLFGIGWALTGACPGPLYAIVGTGVTVFSVAILSAIAGTWVYEYYKEKLPH